MYISLLISLIFERWLSSALPYKVNIEIKNISADKLNISTEELMQRFVRGDKSRTTEGSGLRTINIKRLDSITKR